MSCQFDTRKPELIRNLLKLYRKRTEADNLLGSLWYPAAQAIVRDWSTTYGYSETTVACVIAAISPQVAWERNLIIADDTLARRPASIGGVIQSNLRKAERLRDETFLAGTTLSSAFVRMVAVFPCGSKVAHFAANLSGDMSAVTVDTHAIQAALADVQATYALKWEPYRVFAECYARAADKVGIAPATFQSIIWHTWKRLYPSAYKIQARRQWHVIGEY